MTEDTFNGQENPLSVHPVIRPFVVEWGYTAEMGALIKSTGSGIDHEYWSVETLLQVF
jgi:hypothetical protein